MLSAERPQEMYTKYERARIIGARALQISQGAPLLIKLSEAELREIKFSPVQIAKREFEAGVIPIAIRREVLKRIAEEPAE